MLDYHEQESPLSHIKKYELVKGDSTLKIDEYLKNNPETIFSFAYFDFDIYESTKKCFEAINLYNITKGTVIGLVELSTHHFSGETLALKEVLVLNKYSLHLSPFSPSKSYLIIK